MKMLLIKALFNNDCPLTKDENSYVRMLENEDFLMIAPQVYFLLKQQNRLPEVPAFFQAKLKEKFSESLVQNFFIKTQENQVLRKFEEQGIKAIPLKGVGFAEKVFGHMAARPTSDIDLLIQQADIEKAIDSVLACGFAVEEEPIPEHFHCSYSKPLPGSMIPLKVEIHWNIIREDTAAIDIQEFWQEAVPRPANVHIKELSTYHNFYMICLHGWRHNLQSLKYFLDIIQMIHLMKDDLDYSKLLHDAQRHKTSKRIIRTLSIVYQEFPFLDEWAPFPQKRAKYYWGYHPEKNKSISTYVNYIDYQFFSFDTLGHSMKEFLYLMRYEILPFKK